MRDWATTSGSLIGKTIKQVFRSIGEEYLCFSEEDWGSPDRKCVYWQALGDCCSESWFESIDGFSNLIGHEVVSVEDVDMPEAPDDGLCRQEYDIVYGIKITTTRGHAIVIFRNSSNGYYGGWANVSDQPAEATWVRMRSSGEYPKDTA